MVGVQVTCSCGNSYYVLEEERRICPDCLTGTAWGRVDCDALGEHGLFMVPESNFVRNIRREGKD